MAGGTSLLSGRNYINCHKVRIGALSTRSRTIRGICDDRFGRARCVAQETNNHVLQIYPRAHKARIDRHNAVLSYLGCNLRRQGFEFQEEPHYQTQEGLMKPDIVATMDTLGLVIDAQIADEQSDLERARTVKIRKYTDNPDIEQAIQRETGATNIRHLPIILSWRGIWCKTSASDFLTLGTITRRDLAVIATSMLIAHRDFNRLTAVTFGR